MQNMFVTNELVRSSKNYNNDDVHVKYLEFLTESIMISENNCGNCDDLNFILTKAVLNKILSSIRSNCIEKELGEFIFNLKEKDLISSKQFQIKCDQIFKSSNETDIFNYITQPIDNRQNVHIFNVFKEYFDERLKNARKTFLQSFSKNLEKEIDNLKRIIESLSKYVEGYSDSSLKSEVTEVSIQKLLHLLMQFYSFHFNMKHQKTNGMTRPQNNLDSLTYSDTLFENDRGLYFRFLKVFLNNLYKQINMFNFDTLKDLSENEINLLTINNEQILKIFDNMYDNLVGCTQTCPFCGVKCQMNTKTHDVHFADMHRIMAFGGCTEYNGDNKGFVFDICNSKRNINEAHWSLTDFQSVLTKQTQKSDTLDERIKKYHLSDTILRITLYWQDRNDLDLHVICPCDTKVYFRNKCCPTCKMQLEHDMNSCFHDPPCNIGNIRTERTMGGCSLNPIEHVCFVESSDDKHKLYKPRFGKYEILVRLFEQKPNQPKTSKFNVEIAIAGKIYKTFENLEVSVGNPITPVNEFDFTQELLDTYVGDEEETSLAKINSSKFTDHISQFETSKNWNIIEYSGNDYIERENNMKIAWNTIHKQMLKKYSNVVDFDNTPNDYKILSVSN